TSHVAAPRSPHPHISIPTRVGRAAGGNFRGHDVGDVHGVSSVPSTTAKWAPRHSLPVAALRPADIEGPNVDPKKLSLKA
ncbi:MAG TPA: hypothetical protein VGD55_09500, partial [Acidothermaceae bacterium]